MQCGGCCRYCFRRRRVGGAAGAWTAAAQARALAYIAAHPEIREVILTGGDPLMLPDAPLLALLRRLRRKSGMCGCLRVHTRMPAYNPFRITRRSRAAGCLASRCGVVAHFNHPRELTPTAVNYLQRLRRPFRF